MTAGGKTNWHEFTEAILEEAAQMPKHCRVVPSRDRWKRTADAPGDPNHGRRIPHRRPTSPLFGSLEFKIRSRLRNPATRLAETIEASIFSEHLRRKTMSREHRQAVSSRETPA